MFHLSTLIKQLRRLLETKSDLEQIKQLDKEILDTVTRLWREHGKDSDIGAKLGVIFRAANRMRLATSGGMGLGFSGAFKYELGLRDLESMEKELRAIGTILKIEFEELES